MKFSTVFVFLCMAVLAIYGLILVGVFKQPAYSYRLTVIDGDTIIRDSIHYRLLGFDTPEIKGKCQTEREKAWKAKERLETLIQQAKAIDLVSAKRQDIYGRTLAYLFINGKDVGKTLIEENLARKYHGGKRKGWCK